MKAAGTQTMIAQPASGPAIAVLLLSVRLFSV